MDRVATTTNPVQLVPVGDVSVVDSACRTRSSHDELWIHMLTDGCLCARHHNV